MYKKPLTLLIILSSIFIFTGCTRPGSAPLNLTSEDNASPTALITTGVLTNTDNDLKFVEKYVPYSKQVFENSTNKRRVLFFYANWCPICIPANKEFTEKMNSLPQDVVLIRVNYNDTETDQEEKDLAKKYGITYQHSFVQIDQSGNSVTKWNGGQLEELLSNLK